MNKLSKLPGLFMILCTLCINFHAFATHSIENQFSNTSLEALLLTCERTATKGDVYQENFVKIVKEASALSWDVIRFGQKDWEKINTHIDILFLIQQKLFANDSEALMRRTNTRTKSVRPKRGIGPTGLSNEEKKEFLLMANAEIEGIKEFFKTK